MAKKRVGIRSTVTGAGQVDFVSVAEAYAREAVADVGQLKFCKWVRLAAQRHLDDLQRSGPDWPYVFDRWHGNDICDFISKLPHIKGTWETGTLKLEPPQIFILVVCFGWRRKEDGTRRFRSVYIEMARKGAKALDLDTPIPTPGGWCRMGDLQVGDRVFDERGLACRVVATSPIFLNHECFEVEFSDGEKIIADAGHLWRTDARCKGNGTNGKARSSDDDIRTTAEIAATLSVGRGRIEWNHSIPVAAPLDLPESDLPIPPYTFGAWLGDGHSVSARLTVGYGEEEIVDLIRAEGVSADERESGSSARLFQLGSNGRGGSRKGSLQAKLRAAGALGDKHIPPAYLRASIAQRMALLRGLMDTDGTVDERGHCSFVTTLPRLRDGVIELISSLGFKLACSEERAKLAGRDCGAMWRIRFIARADRPVFGLQRKRARLKLALDGRRARSGHRQIVACRPVETRPVRCIQVDSPSRLYLAGRGMVPTHNSTLTAGVSLYCLCCENEPGPEIIIGATTGEQAGKVFEPAKRMVEKTPDLREAFGLQTFARSVTCAGNNGFIQPINAKGKTQDGWNPHLGVLDELHAHKDRALYDVIRSAFGSRKNPLMWVITTAGFDTSGVCYEQRSFVIKVLEGTIKAEHYFGIIFTIDTADDYGDGRKDGDDPYDERVWIKANPMLGVTPSLTEMRTLAIDAKASPAAEGGFQTKNLNIWLNAASRWLNMAQWKRCEREISWDDFDGLDCWAGADLADKDDITALVLSAFDKSGRLIWKPIFWLPDAVLRPGVLKDDQMHLYRGWLNGGHLRLTPGDWVDHNEIEAQLDEWVERYSIRHITGDAFAAFQQMAVRLNDRHASPDRPIASILPKSAKNVTDAAKELEKRVKAGPHMFGHDGNPIMTWMAANTCVSRRRDETLLPIKESEMSPNKIDGIDAGISALAPAVIGGEVKQPKYQMIVLG